MNSPKIKNKIVAYETVKIEQTKTIVKKPLFHFSFTLYIYMYIYIYIMGVSYNTKSASKCEHLQRDGGSINRLGYRCILVIQM